MAKKEELTKKEKSFRRELVEQMLKLTTSGFGLVAALAWNELIKSVIEDYIKPYLGKESTIVSQLLYALVVTILAVAVTYYLTKLAEKVK